MDAVGQDGKGKKKFTTPRWVQAWFLERSRDNWRQKHQQLKRDAKRLLNRVNDVTRSRQKWREQAEKREQRIKELETQVAALQEQAVSKKK